MPIYEYECPEHGVFELIEKISENPDGKPIKCQTPGCRKKARRLISAAAFHLKGSGWYKTDYSPAKASAKNDSDKSVGESSSKPTTTSSDDSGGGKSEKPTDKSETKPAKGESKTGSCGSGCGCH